MAGRPRCPVVPPRRRGSARPRERGGGRTQGETDPRGGGAKKAPADHGSRSTRRWRRRSARRPRRWIRRRAACGEGGSGGGDARRSTRQQIQRRAAAGESGFGAEIQEKKKEREEREPGMGSAMI